MRISFTKMHGLGNDFVVLDGRDKALPPISNRRASAIANRTAGIGCDQLIVLENCVDADFRMRIFNADGGEVESCGNASRAVALLHGKPAQVLTGGGIIALEPADGGATVDMGSPSFEWQDIPLTYAMDTTALPVGWEELSNPVAVNVGNPHVVFFVDNCDAIALDQLGPQIENDPLFPQRINVNVATIEAPGRIRLRVWERGVGLTRACGTGACATAVAAARIGRAERKSIVALPGGELNIHWTDQDRILMTGPATESFRGDFEWDDYS